MKDLSTVHKVLLFLCGVILVNVLVFIIKSSAGEENILNAPASLQKYIIKNYNKFYIPSNSTLLGPLSLKIGRNSTHGNVTNQNITNNVDLDLILTSTTQSSHAHATNVSAAHTFESFCKLSTAGGVSGCTDNFKGFFQLYSERCSHATPKTRQPLCDCFPKSLVGWEQQTVSLPVKNPSKYKLDAEALGIEPGGHWRPRDCEPRQRVAIIVPYRNRPEHLAIFKHRLHQFMQRQQSEYQIFIIEQNQPQIFSRSSLMNIGFLEANKTRQFDCYIFSDVDLLPEDDRNMYTCYFSALHLGAYVSKFKYKVLYDSIFGGISALSHEDVLKTNLFSDRFFGWGGEDDDLFHRVMSAGLTIYRYPRDIGRVFMITHKRDPTNINNPARGDGTRHYQRQVYLNHGVKQTNYKVLKKELQDLITLVTVNILPPSPSEDCLVKKGVNGSKNEYLSCWGDAHFKAGALDCCASGSKPRCCHKIMPVAQLGKKRIQLVTKS